jgi:hypothetical protein
LSNGDLYGPKSSGVWGQPFNLKGEQGPAGTPGAPGAPGAAILSGTTVPTTALGKSGDFYINLRDMTIYGPKTTLGWGSPVSLRSDNENNVSTYIIKPDWNKNIVNTNALFTTSSGEYIFPGDVKSTYYVMYAAASQGARGLDANVSLNQWKELVGAYNKFTTFPYIVVGLGDPSMRNVKVERVLVSSNTVSSKYKFQVSGDGSAYFDRNSLWIFVKSFRYDELKAKDIAIEDMSRYLRVK